MKIISVLVTTALAAVVAVPAHADVTTAAQSASARRAQMDAAAIQRTASMNAAAAARANAADCKVNPSATICQSADRTALARRAQMDAAAAQRRAAMDAEAARRLKSSNSEPERD